MERKESSEKHSFLDSITGNRRVAIASGIVLTVIVIFGLLMTRQILFFDVNVETIFFIITVVVGYGIISWILLKYTEKITAELRSKSRFIRNIQMAIKIIQFSLFGILLISVFNQLIYGPYNSNSRYFSVLVFAISSTISGIILGLLAYNVNARKLKDYLTITALGIISVGIANETSANHVTYGTAVHSLVLLSSYMFTLGLYSAAVSISQDTSLRKTIKKSIPELFHNIGAAQIEQVLKERVMKLVRANQEKMEEETGGVSYSLTEEELKDYMQEVIREKQSK